MSRSYAWLPASVLNEGVLRLDHSGFTALLSCFRRGGMLLSLRRELDRRDASRAFGTAVHAAVHARRLHGSGPYGPEVQAEMELALEKAFKGVELTEDDYLHLGRAKEVVGLYQKEWPLESFEVVASEQSAEKEMGWMSWWDGERGEVRTCKLHWQGRCDEIGRDKRTGKGTILDLKTTGYYDSFEDKYRQFKDSRQFKLYCWLFSGVGGLGEIRDAAIDLVVVRKPLSKPRKDSPPRTEFVRFPISYTADEIEECKREVLEMVGYWLTSCAKGEVPPPMSGKPWECRRCQFRGVCEQGSEGDRMKWLASGAFRDYKWNPMRGEEEDK